MGKSKWKNGLFLFDIWVMLNVNKRGLCKTSCFFFCIAEVNGSDEGALQRITAKLYFHLL